MGIHAAQNLVHAHFHVYRNLGGLADFGPARIDLYKSIVSPSLHISERNDLILAAGGLRTGQVLFLPTDTRNRPEFDDAFARELYGVTDVYTRKLMSVQNNPVDFAFEISVRHGRVAFGGAYPVVGPLGTMEFFAPLMPEAKYFNIGWPEEETLKLWSN
ncbi:MAG: hypothetical protein FJY98_00390 [Candidatus Liptonbacteria bacterium]|nr:hypothetical protein [Candidatus Liptonbacteria bacterium]